MRSNRIKIKYDLYPEREKIYIATMDFIGIINAYAKANKEQINDFLQKTQKSQFLFGRKITNVEISNNSAILAELPSILLAPSKSPITPSTTVASAFELYFE